MVGLKAGLELRPARADDAPWIVATESRPEFHTQVGNWPEAEHRRALSDVDHRYLIAQWRIGTQQTTPQAVQQTVQQGMQPAMQQQEQRCGFAILRGLSSPHRNVELKRFVIATPEQGTGSAVLSLVMQYVFEDLGAHRLWLDVFEDNLRARHVYRKAGFQEDGVFREAIYRDGEFHTLVLMAVLDREFWALQRAGASAHTA
ncbi:MAG: GNAT family N-acetyltransferase [Acidobacteriaceae bacterium]